MRSSLMTEMAGSDVSSRPTPWLIRAYIGTALLFGVTCLGILARGW